jgi:SNF2 family DNA or RNA helicase
MSQSHELSVVWRGEFPKIQETEEVPPVHLRIVCEATSLEIDPSHQLYLTPVIVRKKSDLSPRVERQSLSPQENQEISRMASELFREFRLRLEEPRELSWGLARELLQQLARAGWEVETRVPSLLLPPVYGDGTFERVTAESSNAGVTFKFSEGILSSGIWDQARREGWKEIPLRGESEFEWRWVPLAAFPKTEEQMERSRAFFERLRAWKGDSTSGLKLFALERDIQATGLQLETQDLRLDYQKFRSTLSGSSPRTKLPSIFSERVVLRPYQVEGIGWIQALHELGLGALLADDMGLGKSLQAMAQIRGNGERALILCPTSVLSSWQQQLQAFRPDLRVVVYHGMSRKWDSHAEVVLSSYGMLRVDAARFSEMWDLLVLDETQTLKNPESQISQATLTLRATRRLGLSGTPIENRVSDLWVPLQILVPGLVGSLSEFKAATQNDWDRTRLKGLLAPLILRRRKSEVLRDLPEKTEQILSVELGEKEREIYRYLLRSSKKEILAQGGENGVPILEVLEALMRLRQVVTDPALLPEGFLEDRWSEDSSKTKVFLEHLESSLEQGRNCLVFSQWTSYLDRLERSLQALKVPYLRLDGSTPNRGEVIRKFQDPAGPPVLLISLKAGGVGTTLTRADQVYLMDPWWNPAVEEQAMDRAHRIGQKNPVFVYRLQVSGTIEESLEELKRQKRDLAESWMSGRQESQVPHEEWLDLLRSLSE